MINLNKKYGEWALVTGASSGIGEEFVKRLARMGMNVILTARREEKLKNIANEIEEKNNVKTLVVSLDLTTDNFLAELLEALGEREIGMLINNAGYGSAGEFVNNNARFEIDMVKLNCVAPTVLTHHFVKGMKERGKGAIIFLGSVVSFQATPMMTTYSATKVFNSYLGNGLWYELKKYGIDVLSLNPGGTDTEFQRIATTSSGPYTRTAQNVVDTAFKALGKKMSVVDGILNKLTVIFGKLVPSRLLVTVAGNISGKMYNKYKKEK